MKHSLREYEAKRSIIVPQGTLHKRQASSCSRRERFIEKTPWENLKEFFSGAANQIRTGDLILTKDVLYHLSHSSIADNKNYYNVNIQKSQVFFSYMYIFLS